MILFRNIFVVAISTLLLLSLSSLSSAAAAAAAAAGNNVLLPDAVDFSKPTLVTSGASLVRRGLNAIVPNFNWRFRNVTELYVGSVESEALYKFDLASGELTKLVDVEGGVSALAWKSRLANGQSLENVGTSLYYASPKTGRVYTIERSDDETSKTKYVTKEVASSAAPIVGVRSLAFTRHNQQLSASTHNATDHLFQYEDSKIRKAFCDLGHGYGCLGQVAFYGDNSLFGVSQRDRTVVRVYSGVATTLATLDADTLPVGVAFDSKNRLYVGANRFTANERQAEIWRLDISTKNLTLVAAIGGALLDSFAFSFDDRLFLTDVAHGAIHEVEFLEWLAEETDLINRHLLASGAKHAGGAGAKNFNGNQPWRTRMLFGDESLTSGGGVTAFSTPDGTEIVLVADEYQLKSVTANKFVDSWPLPIESTTSKTKCDDFPRATNVHVMPTLSNDSTSPIVYQRSAIVTDSFNGKVYQFSAFAPHKGDFVLQHSWSDGFEQPYGVAQAVTGSILVADFGTGQIRQTDGYIVADGLEGPCGLAIGDANGKIVYVSEWTAGRLVRIDADAHTRSTLLDGLNHPEGVAVNPLNGHILVIESGGAGRLMSVDPNCNMCNATEIARGLPRDFRQNDLEPRLFTGLAFGDVVGDNVAGGDRSAPLYVSFPSTTTVWRMFATQMIDDPFAKPRVPGIVLPTQVERDGRRVALVHLWGTELPVRIAVAVGTWIRFITHRTTAVSNGKQDSSGQRWLVSTDVPGWKATFLYPEVSHNVHNWQSVEKLGPATYEIQMTKIGLFHYRDALHGLPAEILVYDAAYDDPKSPKYRPDATYAPTTAPPATPLCRTKEQVECPPGTYVNATTNADGCITSEIHCYPVGYSVLNYPVNVPLGNPGNIHGGIAPYVPRSWRVGQPIVAPEWPGSVYSWKKWREWWQTAQPGSPDPSQYWYGVRYYTEHRSQFVEDDHTPYEG